MTKEEAIKLLDPETTAEAIAEIEYYHGFHGREAAIAAITDACSIAVKALREKTVVHCKDCKYNVANSKHEPLDITDYTDITCEYFMTDGMSPDDYCSQGVKIPVISMEDVPKLMREGD